MIIQELKNIERHQMIDLLENADWCSLNIDYDYPHVERVWCQLGDKRLSLHVIHPCPFDEPLMHPHTWLTSFHVLPMGGIYEQTIAHCKRDPLTEEITEFVPYVNMKVQEGMYYEMIHEDCGHFVRPLYDPVYTVMLSSKVIWPNNAEKADKHLKPLSDERKEEIKNIFKEYYVEFFT